MSELMRRYSVTYIVGILRDADDKNDWERYRSQPRIVLSEHDDIEEIAREASRAGLRQHALQTVREEQGCSEGDIVTVHGVEIIDAVR